MLQLANDTEFAAERCIQLDRDGNQIWVVAVKGTFTIANGEPPVLSKQQEPVCLVPQFAGAAGRSTMLRDFEMPAAHPGTTVAVLGIAHTPRAEPAIFVDAGIAVGTVAKTVRVIGDRYWVKDRKRIVATYPQTFSQMPIAYERAFGGAAAGNGAEPEVFPANPIGAGFAVTSDDLHGKPLPNIENVSEPIEHWRSRPTPMGFAPIAPSWSPRKEYAGTYSAQWQAERMPLWPVDFDPRFYLAAPADQVSATPLRGGEQVWLRNLTPSGDVSFRLPRVHFSFRTSTASQTISHRAQIDRVIIEPELAKLVMVWRTSLHFGNDARRVQLTAIDTKRVLR